jgi:hypothetical protein
MNYSLARLYLGELVGLTVVFGLVLSILHRPRAA